MLNNLRRLGGVLLLATVLLSTTQVASAKEPDTSCWFKTVETITTRPKALAAGNGASVGVEQVVIRTRVRVCGGGGWNAAPQPTPEQLWYAMIPNLPECQRTSAGLPDMCQYVPPDPVTGEPARPIDRSLVESYVRQMTLDLELPEPEIHVGPDPSVNKWDMAVVGFPLWIWTEEPTTLSESLTDNGITIELSAVRDSVTFDFGDKTTLTCTRMSPLPSNYDAGDPSPTCGHVYEYPSLPDGTYTITATAHWTFTWSALGYTGTLPGSVTANRELPVGELQAVLVPVEG